MKVRDLIALLEDCDASAEVYLMSQQKWPFEHSVHGVATRGDWAEESEQGDEWEESNDRPYSQERWSARSEELPRSDVFLIEGSQLRYGAKSAWEVARRR